MSVKVGQMLADGRNGDRKQCGHELLGEPDRLVFHADFDTVFALDVFNVIDKKFIPNTLNQIRLKMKINGKLIIHQPRSRQILSSLWKVRFKKYPGGLIEEHDLIQLLEQCGFSCNSLQRYTTLFPFLRYREIFLVEKVLPNFFLTRFIITAYAV